MMRLLLMWECEDGRVIPEPAPGKTKYTAPDGTKFSIVPGYRRGMSNFLIKDACTYIPAGMATEDWILYVHEGRASDCDLIINQLITKYMWLDEQ